jgi:hypothetical protein
MAETNFGGRATKHEFVCVLIYKLQRKKSFESNEDNTSKEKSSTSIQLLVICEPQDEYGFFVRAQLIKHSNTITWDEDKLRELYSMRHALLNKRLLADSNDVFKKYPFIVEETWLSNDTTALVTRSMWESGDYVFEITISEGTRKGDYMEPLWIPSNV